MLGDYSNKTCCVVDNGLFTDLATTLAKSFGRVLYHTPWVGAFPTSNQMMPGKGIPGVTRCDDFWKIKDEVDLWVFPDVYFGSVQVELRSQGKRVWGSGMGEELELRRKEAKEHLKKAGINVGKYEVVIGMDALKAYLMKHENVWVKMSTTRGDMETFNSKDYKNIETRLDELEGTLGAKKKVAEFIVEDAIEDAVEVGYDGYLIDGKAPKKCMTGIETKAKGYVGVMKDYKDIPKQVKDVNDKLADTLKKYKYRNSFCVELRIDRKGKAWAIDPLARFGSPPGDLWQLMYKNLSDILWYGAEGECIDPEPAAKYGVELLIASEWADKHWQAISFPKAIRDNLKFRNLTMIEGEYYVIPSHLGLGLGAIVAVGDTVDAAIKKAKECSEQIETYDAETFPESLGDAVKQNEKLKKYGISLL